MWFDQFQAKYGSTDLQLDGFLENAINYALGGNKTLSGNFNLNAHYINIDEFMAFYAAVFLNGSYRFCYFHKRRLKEW